MAQIFTGFLLIFLDFNLNLGQSSIGLIPDFIGHYFLVKGLAALAAESAFFPRARPVAVGMGIYTALLYLLDLSGITVNLGWLGILLGTISTLLALYVSHCIVCGVEDMQLRLDTDLGGTKLRSTWKVMAFFQGISLVAIVIPAIVLICILVSTIAAICFLVAVHRTKVCYEEMPNHYGEV